MVLVTSHMSKAGSEVRKVKAGEDGGLKAVLEHPEVCICLREVLNFVDMVLPSTSGLMVSSGWCYLKIVGL